MAAPAWIRFVPVAARPTARITMAIVETMGAVNVGLISAGVAFYALLAIFPGITALVAIWGLFSDPEVVAQQAELLEPLAPEGAYDIIEGQITSVAASTSSALGWATVVSLLTALWASRRGVVALVGGLNAVKGVAPRNGFVQNLLALALTAFLIGVVLIAMATVVLAPVALAFIPLGPFSAFAVEALRWIIGAGVVTLGIAVLYRFGPNRRANGRLVTFGVCFAVVVWGFASWGFSTYLSNFGNYNQVYGSLGAVIALLMWFYLSAYVVLLGGLIDVERAKDAEASANEASNDAGDTQSPNPPEDAPAA